MLKHLKLKNFRRHADTDISFADDAQLTLISGRNGSGKSTLLEAIRYALYGTPRAQTGNNGRARLEDLVRRGAELEGLTVVLDFTANGRDYTITRRWDSGNSYALLETGGNAVTTGPKEVTQEVTRLFGMDRVGFDLAVFASQQQLDGLAALSPSTRANTVSRLLRLDAITKARDDARGKMTEKKRLLQAIGKGDDVALLAGAVASAEASVKDLTAARDETAKVVTDLTSRLSGHADVQRDYQEAMGAKARAEGRLSSARDDHASATTTLERLKGETVDKPAGAGDDLDALMLKSDSLGEQLEAAREQTRQHRDRELLESEIATLQKQLSGLADESATIGGVLGASEREVRADSALTSARNKVEKVREEGQRVRTALGVREAHISRLTESIESAKTLGGVCDHCGQNISDDHRDSHLADLEQQLVTVKDELSGLQAELTTLRGQYSEATTAADEAQRDLDKARRGIDRARNLDKEIASIEHRVDLHTRRAGALPDAPGDEQSVAQARAAVVDKIRQVRAAEQALQAWERHQAAVTSAELRVATTDKAIKEAAEAVDSAAIPQTLLDQVNHLSALAQELAVEKEIAAECATATAVAEQELIAAKDKLKTAEAAEARRNTIVEGAVVHEAASRLLTAVSESESASVRPALEGAVSSVLGLMSEGRFDAVKIGSDYSMKVRDDGALRPLSELSGGEQNLAALALRLGLATVVSSRHGATSPGFLVLDEVFGSQDVGRREAILTGLRALKGTWPQILLVSHVEGAEDTVDEVLQVERIEVQEDDAEYEVAEAVVTRG